jgi:50S ribosomal subunit-associated GTPase HflX
VIDASEGDVAERFATIDAELAAYGAGLDERPQAIVLNKRDLLPEPPRFEVDDPRIVATFAVSCATGEGIPELKNALFRLCPPAPAMSTADEQGLVEELLYRPRSQRRAYRIYRTDRGFRITGTPPEGEELVEALRQAGAKKGHEIEIGDEELVFE